MTDRAHNPAKAQAVTTDANLEPPLAARRVSWFTPREVARERRVRVSKVMGWVRSGELEAVNHASNRLGPPRWKISSAALANFDAARSSRTLGTPGPRRRRRSDEIAVKEFFE